MKTYRVAIIGANDGIAQAHFNAVAYSKDRAQVVAACDVDADKLAAYCTRNAIPKAYSDYKLMLSEQKPDLVIIGTPPPMHAPMSIAAMEVGAWVLCEKPLCCSLAELDQIAAVEARTGTRTSSVFQMRFGSAGVHARKLIADGTLGRPFVGLANTLWFRDRSYYAIPWRAKTMLGSTTMNQGIHTMDLLLYLLGEWEEVHAVADTLFHDIDVEDVSMAHVKFANGARAAIMNSSISPREETKIRIDCEHATIEADYLYSYKNANWRLTPSSLAARDSARAAEINDAWEQLETDHRAYHTAQVTALLKNMDEGTCPITSGAEARRTIEFLSSLYKSAFTGKPVTRGNIQPGDPFYDALNGGAGPIKAAHLRNR
ncbi:oxidoreductase [Cephaloticoccus primus]|uniref:Oxidoreductase n=1 Tax=Cephaloticoccus primus TaxID=1548207 RepID=A0A139SUI1_9BACT|nr:Gfo/Idh/MocA family oxidoreductase [Cephaloticoccus primus]KXU38111.1 oxidoreductase [Cephaloticoccus primus]